MKDKDYLTPTQVANMLMVSPVTVRAWAQKGMLPAETTPGGHRRFRYEDVRNFAAQHKLNLDKQNEPQRILIIDDDEAFAGFVREVLSTVDVPLVCETAPDGFEAGRKIETFRPHVLLLDLMMPGLDGFQVCERLKSVDKTRAIRVIAMTGFASEENVQRITACGAEACLSKPFSPVQLLAVLGLDRASDRGDVA